jgi:hypothetical protein
MLTTVRIVADGVESARNAARNQVLAQGFSRVEVFSTIWLQDREYEVTLNAIN